MSPRIWPLTRAFGARAGAPSIDRVELTIFERRYYTDCMRCTSCADWCCSHGVDVDEQNVARILARRAELEPFVGAPADAWFDGPPRPDAEFAGGAFRRTSVVDGACVFLDRSRRGCRLHAFAVERGLDYHELKPLVSTLFPLTFDGGLLHPSGEVDDGTLVCLGSGPTLYRGARSELAHHFGEILVRELDALEEIAVVEHAMPPPNAPGAPTVRFGRR